MVGTLERRRVRLVSSLLLAAIPIALVLASMLYAADDPRFDLRSLSGFVVVCGLIFVAYAISRSRWYRIAVWWVSVGTTPFACAFVIMNPQDPGWYAFAVLTPVMAGAILPLRRAAQVFAGHVVVISVVSCAVPGLDLSVRIVASMFALMASALLLVASHHRNGEEQIRQAELEARERRHRAVLDVTFDGIALVHGGRVVQANRGFSAIFGQDVSGGLVNLFRVADQPQVERVLERTEGAVVEARGINGRVLEVVAHRCEDALDVIAVRDITARRRAEQDLLHAQRIEAVGRLAGGIAHDFNNLLMVLGAEAELLRDEVGAKHEASLDTIDRATQRATQLTRQLLAFSRRQILQPEVLDLHDVLGETQRLLSRVIGEAIVLRTTSAPGLHLRVDPVQLEQVIVNLAVNARDAMPSGGRLTLHAGGEGDCVVLRVRDSGEGIEEAMLEHVFEPFFTTKPRGKGTGLGLSVVLGIVEQSGGRIDVESRPGDGTVFTLRFPKVSPEAATSAPAVLGEEAVLGSATGQTILLVEDEVGVAAAIERMLPRESRVLVANSGMEAAALIDDPGGSIDVAVIDIVLQDRNGIEIAREVRARHPDVTLVHISGYADEDLDGVPEDVILLRKPFTGQQLRSAMASASGS